MGFVDTREKRENLKLTPQHLTELANAIISNKLTRNNAKMALQEIVKTGKPLSEIISEQDLGNVDESETIATCYSVVEDYFKQGHSTREIEEKPELLNFFVGQVMQKTKGKADPSSTVNALKKNLKKKLDENS